MEPLIALGATLALSAVQISCSALMAARLARVLPAWSRAVRKTHGVGWARLAFQKRAVGSGADPRGIAALLALCLMFGLGAMASALDGRLERSIQRALAGGADWGALGIEAFYTVMFSLLPLLLLSRALRDESSAMGLALQEEAGFPLASERAAKEAKALAESTAKPSSAASRAGSARL